MGQVSFIYGARGLGHEVRSRLVARHLIERGWEVCFNRIYDDTDLIVLDTKGPISREIRRILKGNKFIAVDNMKLNKSASLSIFPHPWLPDGANNQSVIYGSQYVILNPMIVKLGKQDFKHGRDLLITTGGQDPTGIMLHVVKLLHELKYADGVCAMYGTKFRGLNRLLAGPRPSKMHISPFLCGSMFTMARIGIVSFGATAYEFNYLGIPTLVLSHSIEDDVFLRSVEHLLPNGMWYGGIGRNISMENLNVYLQKMLSCQKVDSLNLDGNGASRLANCMEEFYENSTIQNMVYAEKIQGNEC